MPDDNSALQEQTANLIDHCGSLADKARPHPVQHLQIQLFICFNWDEPSRRSLHGLGVLHGLRHSMGISEVILVPLSKRLHICRRPASHRGQAPQAQDRRSALPSLLRCQLGRVAGSQASMRCARAKPSLAPQWHRRIEADHVKSGLAHIYSDGRHCMNGGTRHDSAPAPDKPPTHSESH